MDRLAAREPVYVIDLNVFWDVVRKRPRTPYAAEVVSAALRHLVQIVVTPEFIRELNRTSRPSAADPALEFAVQLPILPEPDIATVDALVNQLASIIFPSKAMNSALSVQDRSDLVHLAIAAHHGANAFVTSERTLLKAKAHMFEYFGIEVLHVEEFARILKEAQKLVPSFRALLSSNTIEVLELMADATSLVESFFTVVPAPLEYREDFLAAGAIGSNRKRVAVMSDRQIVCLASWDAKAGLHSRANVRLVADEEHPAVETVLNCVIAKLCRDATRNGPVFLRLCTPPGHVISKKVAVIHGFRPPEFPDDRNADVLQKLSIGRPILPSSWAKMRKTAQQCSGLELPEHPPDYSNAEVNVKFVTAAGAKGMLSLPRLESLLSPALIFPPGRGGSIAPIRRVYSERLLQASPQLLLEPNREAALFSERVYFSSSRNARCLQPNCALLFYESGGGGGTASVVAVARIVSTEMHAKKEISAEMLRHAVLDTDDLGKLTASATIAVTTFDNVMPLERPVSYARLQQLGCVDSLNLVCSRPLHQDQIVAILEEGFRLD